MIVNGRLLVERYFETRLGHSGIRAARRQFDAWLAEVRESEWASPVAIKAKYASASIVRNHRVVFNISGNNYRLVVSINYRFGVVDIRFFGTHAEYDKIDVGTV